MREDEDTPRIIDRRASSAADRGEETISETGENGAPASEKSLAEQLAEEREKAQSYMASWQRSAADFQNYKRRVEQERDELSRLASAAVIINLLPISDDLERALQNVDARLAGLTWVDGVRLIHRKLQALLEMSGVTEIEADGQSFDPTVHEAVMFGDGDEGKVLSVVQKGYKLGGRVLRQAMVVVGGKKEPAS